MFIPVLFPPPPPAPSTRGAAPPILADRINPKTGDVMSLLEGDDPTNAAIQWQATVRQGSGAALGDNGNRLHLITKGTEDAPTRIADEGRRIMSKFITRGDVSEVAVTGDVVGGSTATASLAISYFNNHTRKKSVPRSGGT
mgnify:CR=1 FL=1